MNRRVSALLCVAALGLAGCTGDTAKRGDLSEPKVTDLVRAQVSGILARRDPAPGPDPTAIRAAITPDIIAQLNAPTLFAVLNGAASVPQRVAENNGAETYLTEDGITLITRRGLIVGTRGLGNDIIESDVAEPLIALARGPGRVRATRSHAWLDGEDRLQRRSFTCGYAPGDGGQIIETCNAIDLAFENAYVLRGGRVVASRQWLGPKIGYISLEQLKF